jgi:hypothetical protein
MVGGVVMVGRIKKISMDVIKNILEEANIKIKEQYFIPFFESVKGKYEIGILNNSSPKIIVKEIKCPEDLEDIPSHSPGFYVILSDYKNGFTNQNLCDMKLNGLPDVRAIYRGEAYNVRLRLLSHLFKNLYDQERNNDIQNDINRDDNYSVCLKLDDREEKGINIDKDKNLAKSRWFVAYHGMRYSDGPIRKIAESAFDDVFGKPVCSRD